VEFIVIPFLFIYYQVIFLRDVTFGVPFCQPIGVYRSKVLWC